jgi:ABC-type uncharacterized transport system involved in gliding motility auxiliary subunit
MCYLCFAENPFNITDNSKKTLQAKKARARVIKEILKSYEDGLNVACETAQEEIEKLKQEQWQLAKDI